MADQSNGIQPHYQAEVGGWVSDEAVTETGMAVINAAVDRSVSRIKAALGDSDRELRVRQVVALERIAAALEDLDDVEEPDADPIPARFSRIPGARTQLGLDARGDAQPGQPS